MNTVHLKYALEVAKTGSISGAAENLYMNQPQLSKAIRDLENRVGVPLFKRTSKGVVPTGKGEEFLMYAAAILENVSSIENLYKPEVKGIVRLNASAPRASYIADAFYNYAKLLDGNDGIQVSYHETNSRKVILNVSTGESSIGVIRFNKKYEKYYMQFADEKDVTVSPLYEFRCSTVISKKHPLADRSSLKLSDLESKYIKILYGDHTIPLLPVSKVNEIISDTVQKNSITVFDRHSQYSLLSSRTDCYALGSKVSESELERFSLVQIPVEDAQVYKDMLVWRRNYSLSNEEKQFIEELNKSIVKLGD